MLTAEKPREDVVAPLIGWKKRSHRSEEINNGADVKVRGYWPTSWEVVFQYLAPLPPTPMLPPTHVKFPLWGAPPWGCKIKVIPATSEWFRNSKMKHPSVTVLNWEAEHDLFSTCWILDYSKPTGYNQYIKHSAQKALCWYAAPARTILQSIFLFATFLLIDWSTRAQFYISLTVRMSGRPIHWFGQLICANRTLSRTVVISHTLLR